jgi:hypothetical protein
MLLARGDLEAFSCVESIGVIFDFEGELAFEDEEELVGAEVGVTFLRGTGWHEFFDDAEIRCLHEMPAVTVVSLWTAPFVVLR